MPFSGHMDALSEARRVYHWVENDIYLSHISRNTTMFFEVLFFKVFQFFLPDKQAMFFHPDMAHSTSTVQDYFAFVSHNTIFRSLFVLKIPFLFFDMLTAWALYFYFPDKQSGLRSCTMWLFNPVTIFAFYIYSRFESIPIFFGAAALLAVKKERPILAALLLGLCLNGREMMILYFLVLLVAIIAEPANKIDPKRKVLAALILILFAAGTLNLYKFVPGLMEGAGNSGSGVSTIMKEGRVKHLFAFSIHRIMAIPFIYSLILIWTWSSAAKLEKKFLLGSALAMMSFFAFSSHTVHFVAWMVIFPVIFYGYDRRILKPFIAFCLAWIGHWMFGTDLGVFTLWLYAPYSLHFTGIPTIPELYNKISTSFGIFDLHMVIYLFRSFFLATLVYMAVMMVNIIKKNNETA